MRVLILSALSLPLITHAAGGPKTCPLKSQQLRLAHECFSGDMASSDDTSKFLSTDESAKDDMNFCYNAFVIMHPQKGTEVHFTVMKDNEKGQLRIFNYATMEQTISPKTYGRLPASKPTPRVAFKNLKAECYAKNPETDKCSKGVFGFGSSDIPLTVELSRGKGGFSVKSAVKEENAVKDAAEKALNPVSEGDMNQTDTWLAQVVKQRLISNAQRKLAMISQKKLKASRVGEATTQFRYCRMALDGFVHKKKMADPFTDKEKQILDSLEAHLKTTAPAVPE